MNQKVEKTLQLIVALLLGLLAVPLWPDHRIIVSTIFVLLGLAVIKIHKKG